jgi:hypothetical protein
MASSAAPDPFSDWINCAGKQYMPAQSIHCLSYSKYDTTRLL